MDNRQVAKELVKLAKELKSKPKKATVLEKGTKPFGYWILKLHTNLLEIETGSVIDLSDLELESDSAVDISDIAPAINDAFKKTLNHIDRISNTVRLDNGLKATCFVNYTLRSDLLDEMWWPFLYNVEFDGNVEGVDFSDKDLRKLEGIVDDTIEDVEEELHDFVDYVYDEFPDVSNISVEEAEKG